VVIQRIPGSKVVDIKLDKEFEKFFRGTEIDGLSIEGEGDWSGLENITQVRLMDPGALVNKARRQKEEAPIKVQVDTHGQLTIKVIKVA
jgi:hypothetical protein